MRNNVLDELIADYAGITAAAGAYRAAWFLRFVGLEDFPRYREGARLDLYRGTPPLSDGAFRVLHTLIQAAALNLERFDAHHGAAGPVDRALILAALASLRLEDLAAPHAEDLLGRTLDGLRGRLGWQS
jgi:hypothetical protein